MLMAVTGKQELRFGVYGGIPALVRALDDPDLGVRNVAAQALSKISPDKYPAAKARQK